MTIEYVFSADRYVMYSMVHGPPTIWDLINWWERVKRDVQLLEVARYVQLVDFRNVDTVRVSQVELNNFFARVSDQSELLPCRTAIWVNRNAQRQLRRLVGQLRHPLAQQVLSVVDLDVACDWLGAHSHHVRQADALFISEPGTSPRTSLSMDKQSR